MRVGVEHDHHARLDRAPRVQLVQVATIGVRVDLEEGPGAHRRLGHGADVERVRGAALDQAAGRVPDGVDERVLHGADHALGLLLLAEAERRVQARDDPVELCEQLVLVVERAVGQHVRLGAGEYPDAFDGFVRLLHALDLAP